MKKLHIFTLLLLSISCNLLAKTIYYTYDEAGNRISRYTKLDKVIFPSEPKRGLATHEMLNGLQVNIYPNPTEGLLKLEIIGFDDHIDHGHISIFDMSGRIVSDSDIKTMSTTIDITSEPNGVYLLNISLNTSSNTWKIIKK